MQQPFKDIENAKRFILKMQLGLDRIHNPKVKDFQIDALNSFITLVNSFEMFLQTKYHLSSIDGLICGRLNAIFFNLIKDGQPWSLEEIVRLIDGDLRCSTARKDALVSMLLSEEVSKSVVEKNKLPNTSYDEWLLMVDNLLNEFKIKLTWN